MPTQEVEEISRQIDRITFEGDQKGSAAGTRDTPEQTFSRILVAIDGSEDSDGALEWGLHLAQAHGADLTITLVLPHKHPVHATTLPAVNRASAQMWEKMAKEEEATAKRILEAAVEDAAGVGVRAESVLDRGAVVKAIEKTARRRKCDLIVVGSHSRRGLERFLLGSVAEGVRDHAHASVLIARTRPPAKDILLAVDGSAPSRHAGRVVAGIMEKTPSHVHVVHVIHSPVEGLDPEVREKWYRAAQDLREPLMEHARFPQGSWVHYDVHFGDPADEIVRVAKEEETGLVVMGCRGLSGLKSLVAGSVSRRVSHHASASVLIVK